MIKILDTTEMNDDVDIIFGSLLTTTTATDEQIAMAKFNRQRFRATFRTNIFSGYYAILYAIINKVNSSVFTDEQFERLLDYNKDLIVKTKYLVEEEALKEVDMQLTEDDKYLFHRTNLTEKFKKLAEMPIVEELFNTACTVYKEFYINKFAESIYNDCAIIMSEMGLDVIEDSFKVRHYQGLEDATRYCNNASAIIRELKNEDSYVEVAIDSDWIGEQVKTLDEDDGNKLMSFGIRQLDESIGEIRRGNLLGILGGPKMGKTRFSNYLVVRALKQGLNVCVWCIEGTHEEWMSTLTASWIAQDTYELYKKKKMKDVIKLNSGEILRKTYLKDIQKRQLVVEAQSQIALAKATGKLSFIDGAAYIEDFTDIIKNHFENKNPFDIIVVDQLINIMSKSGRDSNKPAMIDKAYVELQSLIQHELPKQVGAIVPSQLKQEAVDELRKNPDAEVETTAGGESSATIRKPDYIIAVMNTREERAVNLTRMFVVGTRHSSQAAPFQVKSYLGCCLYLSDDETV